MHVLEFPARLQKHRSTGWWLLAGPRGLALRHLADHSTKPAASTAENRGPAREQFACFIYLSLSPTHCRSSFYTPAEHLHASPALTIDGQSRSLAVGRIQSAKEQ